MKSVVIMYIVLLAICFGGLYHLITLKEEKCRELGGTLLDDFCLLRENGL